MRAVNPFKRKRDLVKEISFWRRAIMMNKDGKKETQKIEESENKKNAKPKRKKAKILKKYESYTITRY